MKVHWTQNAIDHLVTIFEYIALNSPAYAKGMVDRITRHSEQIADHPRSGRKVPEYDAEDVRELIESQSCQAKICRQDQESCWFHPIVLFSKN